MPAGNIFKVIFQIFILKIGGKIMIIRIYAPKTDIIIIKIPPIDTESRDDFIFIFSSSGIIAIKSYYKKTTNFNFRPGEEVRSLEEIWQKSCFSNFKREHR